jgi:hypothetical protein
MASAVPTSADTPDSSDAPLTTPTATSTVQGHDHAHLAARADTDTDTIHDQERSAGWSYGTDDINYSYCTSLPKSAAENYYWCKTISYPSETPTAYVMGTNGVVQALGLPSAAPSISAEDKKFGPWKHPWMGNETMSKVAHGMLGAFALVIISFVVWLWFYTGMMEEIDEKLRKEMIDKVIFCRRNCLHFCYIR